MKITFDETKSVKVEKGYVVDNYLSKEDGVGYSIVRTHLDGKHPFMKNINSNRTYYLISGKATFVIEEKEIVVQTGKMLVIPRNTKYDFQGKFDALLVDCPAFDANDDIIFEKEL